MKKYVINIEKLDIEDLLECSFPNRWTIRKKDVTITLRFIDSFSKRKNK